MSTSGDQDPTARIAPTPPPTPRREKGGQFAPGTLIAGRYRIAGLLGTGGMGEVYRADDIKLGQQVALKFLPVRLERDPALLAGLHDEVRLGRQIAHPNVCRIYDIVEWEGAHFVAMEYVDGEDLARLLHRIGRLSHDKAVDIARGIAAGLAAAHAKGILHRDLKPANVMIDSHGEARIMDFGLALTADDDQRVLSAGTPAYMAPEQLEGRAATVQSDLYALGLVMYELFTGKRALTARTLPDRIREATSEIRLPSSVVRDLDPAVEGIILRCLANDPAQRPRSGREVIESLPGGDPLAAALAAGETPSPRIVAAAGTEGSLSRRAAWTMLASIAVLFALFFVVRRRLEIANYVPLDRSPEVLRQTARDLLRALDIPAGAAPIAEFHPLADYNAWLRQRGTWSALRHGPPPFVYHLEYGLSPQESRLATLTTTAAGRTTLSLDPRGRLVYLLAPPAGEVKPKAADWKPLLDAAGLDASSLRAVAPRDAPPAPLDARAAWTGTYPGDATPIRVEAAAWQGRPVFFRVTGAWEEANDPLKGIPFRIRAADRYLTLLIVVVIVAALLLAWRSLRLRRGDRQGALRFAITYFAIQATASLLASHYPRELLLLINELWITLGSAAMGAAIVYILYVALEPYARRKWPEHLIAWTRLLSGRLQDPLVGRDVLIGILAGLAYTVLWGSASILASWFSEMDPQPFIAAMRSMNGIRHALALTLFAAILGIQFASVTILILVMSTIVLRRRALAAGAFFVINLAYFLLATGGQLPLVPAHAAVAALLAFIALRYGLLAYAVLQMTFLAIHYGTATSPSWLLMISAIPFAIVAALALWAFRTSLGGQSLFSAALLDD
ncbi:MAG TPA: serine/threonine-protein kinase [Thermoanaerobaculia bacterium]|nr:serine/threonine-protein kinase [Thermoanaerobaculia bacterium]